MISGGVNPLTPIFLIFTIEYLFMNGIQCVIANINRVVVLHTTNFILDLLIILGVEKSLTPKFLYSTIEYLFLNGI